MSQFLGTHQNRLDSKGRVSVPAPFRTLLRAHGAEAESGGVALVLRSSHNHPCIEAWPPASFAALAGPVQQRYDTFSEDQEDIETALYAGAFAVESDKEGRIVLPEVLLAHAGITAAVTFMGLGSRFQIWEPQAAERRRAEAVERTRARRLTLASAPAMAGGPA